MSYEMNVSDGAGEAEFASESEVATSRRDRRRAETRERLYEAAILLLSERDFDAVTVEMITEAADVGKGTFFNYFSNKEAVVAYRFESDLRILTEALRQPLPEMPAEMEQEAPRGAGHVWRRLRSLKHHVIEKDGRCKRLTRTLLALSLTNEAVRAACQSVRTRIIASLRALVEEGQASGELRNDLSADTITEFLANTYFGTLYRWAQSDSDDTLHDALERNYRVDWEGVRRQEP